MTFKGTCERSGLTVDEMLPACKFAYCGCTLGNKIPDSRIRKPPELEFCCECDDYKRMSKK